MWTREYPFSEWSEQSEVVQSSWEAETVFLKSFFKCFLEFIRVFSSFLEFTRVHSSSLEFSRVLSSSLESSRVLSSPLEFSRVFSSFTLQFSRVFSRFLEFSRVLSSSLEFSRVFSSFLVFSRAGTGRVKLKSPKAPKYPDPLSKDLYRYLYV